MAQIQVRDEQGNGIPRINIRISEGQKSSDAAIFDVFTDLAGNTGWPIPNFPIQDYTLWLNDQNINPAFDPQSLFVPGASIATSADIVVTLVSTTVVVTPPSPAPDADLSAVHADGRLFRYANGLPWRWKLVTAFDGFRRFSRGELAALKAYAAWTRSVGGNGWRVFGNWSRTGFDYRKEADYFQQLVSFAHFLADEGLKGEFVCVTDGIPSSETEQRNFLGTCADILAGFPWMFDQKVNEGYKNGMTEPQKYTVQRDGLLVSNGAAAQDAPLYLPSAGYTTIHPPRSDDWARKCGKDAYETYRESHDPVVPDEPKGFWEKDEESGSRTGNTLHAFSAGLGAGLFCPGITAHGDSNTMQLCEVPGPRESKCVSEEFRGVDLIPLDAPNWQYARYGENNPGIPMPIEDDGPPSGIRLTDHMHAMINGGQAVVCNYYPSPNWVAKPANGWRIVEQDGSFVRCER